MANKKASKKDILTNARNHARNVHFRSRLKTYIKKAVEAINKNTEDKETAVRTACRIIDKTVGKGILKKNNAARKKSSLMKAFNNSNIAA